MSDLCGLLLMGHLSSLYFCAHVLGSSCMSVGFTKLIAGTGDAFKYTSGLEKYRLLTWQYYFNEYHVFVRAPVKANLIAWSASTAFVRALFI